MKYRVSKNNLGFSLIEMIVAVLIMAIMAGVAVVAFSSVYKTRVGATAKSVMDSMKQTRSKALGIDNKTDDDGYTNVYAKFYKNSLDSDIYVDVCTNSSGSEVSLASQKLCSDSLNILFADGPKTTGDVKATVGNDIVRVYFKKETGGISLVTKEKADNTEEECEDVNTVIVVNPSDSSSYREIIMVRVTGRCYQDLE